MPNKYKIIFIGDIVGKSGRKIIKELLPTIRNQYFPDIIIANGENAANGKGLTPKIAKELYNAGINILTSGNHIWNRSEIFEDLNNSNKILRPNNYPDGVPGKGIVKFDICGKGKIGIINTQGRIFLQSIDCPFRKTEKDLKELEDCDAIFIDMHGEATSEKKAYFYYFKGKVSAIIGTHTHVQTTDGVILDGTAYLSDVGMTGAFDSIIGVEYSTVINRFLYGTPTRFIVAKNDLRMDFVVLDIENSKCVSLQILEYDFNGNKIVDMKREI